MLCDYITKLWNYIYKASSIRTKRQRKAYSKASFFFVLKFTALLHNGQRNNSFCIVTEMDKLFLFLLILRMSILVHVLALREQLFTTASYRASIYGGYMGIISVHFILKTIFCIAVSKQNAVWCHYSKMEDKKMMGSVFFAIFL